MLLRSGGRHTIVCAMASSAAAKSVTLDALYDEIESLLKRYSPPFTARTGAVKGKRDYNLMTTKAITLEGRKREGLYFASVIGQKDFVGFYFMPIYMAPEMGETLSPALMKLLQGKSCFQVKVMTPELRKGMKDALERGMKWYLENGWL